MPTATEHSSAADDDKPAPAGTWPSINMSKPTSAPSAQMTPSTYFSQSPGLPGLTSLISIEKICSLRCCEAIRTKPSGRVAIAAYVRSAIAKGRTKPSE